MKKEATTNQEENTLPPHPKFSNEKFEQLPEELKKHAAFMLDYQALMSEFAKQIGEYAGQLGKKLHKFYGFDGPVDAAEVSEHMGPLLEHFYPNIKHLSGEALGNYLLILEASVLDKIGAAVYASSSIETVIVNIKEVTPFTLNEHGKIKVEGEKKRLAALSDSISGVMINFGHNHGPRLSIQGRTEGMLNTLENPFLEETFKALELDQLLGVAKEKAAEMQNGGSDFLSMLQAMAAMSQEPVSEEDIN